MMVTTEAPHVEAALADGLCSWFGQPVTIVTMADEPLATRSTYPISRLHVTLDTGEHLRVIFKRLLPTAEPKGDRREVLIYRRLLGGRRFGAPALYASRYNPVHEQYWLFLEDLGEQTLKGAAMADWRAATHWLADMHATYLGREDALRALDCLDEHGPRYYDTIARRARENLYLAGATDALAAFDGLMERFDALVAWFVAQPRTLVHGDIFSWNVMVQPGHVIRPIDWEAAAVGLGAWDLARLFDGWGAAKQPFVAAYVAAVTRATAVPVDWEAFHETVARCAILNVLWRLGWSVEGCEDAAFVADALRALHQGWDRLKE